MKYSVAIPVYNEEETITVLTERLVRTLQSLGEAWEIVYACDGSTDRTWQIINNLHAKDPRIGGVCFSRNFGHQAASTAALRAASGDIVILMDGDLQDPPELITEMVSTIQEGYDVVMAVKRSRTESFCKRAAFHSFYRIQSSISDVHIEPEAGNFSAMTRRVVDFINAMPEHNRYISGLRAFAGFKQTTVVFDRPGRYAGAPRMTMAKLTRLALDGIYSFSHTPIKFITGLGVVIIILSLLFTAILLINTLATNRPVPTWASHTLPIFFLGAVQLISIGVLGEYIVRIYDEVRQRPDYVIAEQTLPKPEPDLVLQSKHIEQ